jgi:hypothetical protein
MMPLSVTNTVAGTIHPSPFLGPIDHAVPVRVDVSELTSDEVDTHGFLKPGVILTREGLLPSSDGIILELGGFAISSTAEEFKTASQLTALIDGRQVDVAADATIPLSAGHVVTASLFGVVVCQVSVAGAFTSKVASTTQAYTTAALALAAAPKADTGNAKVGHIAIAADSGGWTSITDDLTNGSDLTTATFVEQAVVSQSQNAGRGYGVVIEATKVAAGSTTALLDAATDIDVAIATVCMIQRHVLEDSLGRTLTDEELYNVSDSIVFTSL